MQKIAEARFSDEQDYALFFKEGLSRRNRLYIRSLDKLESQTKDRVTFGMNQEKEAFLAGMYLNPNLRGNQLSLDFIRALEALTVQIGLKLKGTSVIRKPILALQLKKIGAIGVAQKSLVEVLPYRAGASLDRPQIAPISKAANSLRGESGVFFDFVERAEADRVYPLTCPERSQVHIYEPYRFESPFDAIDINFSERALRAIT